MGVCYSKLQLLQCTIVSIDRYQSSNYYLLISAAGKRGRPQSCAQGWTCCEAFRSSRPCSEAEFVALHEVGDLARVGPDDVLHREGDIVRESTSWSPVMSVRRDGTRMARWFSSMSCRL